MISFIKKKHPTVTYRVLSTFIALAFIFSAVVPPTPVYAQFFPQGMTNMPSPGTMVPMSPGFTPPMISGITIHPENPLEFDFIIGSGDDRLKGEAFEEESTRLIKYFLAALTVPEEEMWVNLSPYEKDRIIPQGFGDTEMGRDLLAQDYILKQLTASLIYPEEELGDKFWKTVRAKALKQFGTVDIPINTFNKIWIVPEEAVVYEHEQSAFVIKSHLKVMLEEDYIALQNNVGVSKYGLDSININEAEIISGVSSEVVREILIPEIEKEINHGESFANLRQIYNSVILAAWYKKNLQNSLLGEIYVGKNKTVGVDTQDKQVNEKIYNQYVEAFKKGVYNYIKEDYDSNTNQMTPRKYFSGGSVMDASEALETVDSESPKAQKDAEEALSKDGHADKKVKSLVLEINEYNVDFIKNSIEEPYLPATFDELVTEEGKAVWEKTEANIKILREMGRNRMNLPDLNSQEREEIRIQLVEDIKDEREKRDEKISNLEGEEYYRLVSSPVSDQSGLVTIDKNVELYYENILTTVESILGELKFISGPRVRLGTGGIMRRVLMKQFMEETSKNGTQYDNSIGDSWIVQSESISELKDWMSKKFKEAMEKGKSTIKGDTFKREEERQVSLTEQKKKFLLLEKNKNFGIFNGFFMDKAGKTSIEVDFQSEMEKINEQHSKAINELKKNYPSTADTAAPASIYSSPVSDKSEKMDVHDRSIPILVIIEALKTLEDSISEQLSSGNDIVISKLSLTGQRIMFKLKEEVPGIERDKKSGEWTVPAELSKEFREELTKFSNKANRLRASADLPDLKEIDESKLLDMYEWKLEDLETYTLGEEFWGTVTFNSDIKKVARNQYAEGLERIRLEYEQGVRILPVQYQSATESTVNLAPRQVQFGNKALDYRTARFWLDRIQEAMGRHTDEDGKNMVIQNEGLMGLILSKISKKTVKLDRKLNSWIVQDKSVDDFRELIFAIHEKIDSTGNRYIKAGTFQGEKDELLERYKEEENLLSVKDMEEFQERYNQEYATLKEKYGENLEKSQSVSPLVAEFDFRDMRVNGEEINYNTVQFWFDNVLTKIDPYSDGFGQTMTFSNEGAVFYHIVVEAKDRLTTESLDRKFNLQGINITFDEKSNTWTIQDGSINKFKDMMTILKEEIRSTERTSIPQDTFSREEELKHQHKQEKDLQDKWTKSRMKTARKTGLSDFYIIQHAEGMMNLDRRDQQELAELREEEGFPDTSGIIEYQAVSSPVRVFTDRNIVESKTSTKYIKSYDVTIQGLEKSFGIVASDGEVDLMNLEQKYLEKILETLNVKEKEGLHLGRYESDLKSIVLENITTVHPDVMGTKVTFERSDGSIVLSKDGMTFIADTPIETAEAKSSPVSSLEFGGIKIGDKKISYKTVRIWLESILKETNANIDVFGQDILIHNKSSVLFHIMSTAKKELFTDDIIFNEESNSWTVKSDVTKVFKEWINHLNRVVTTSEQFLVSPTTVKEKIDELLNRYKEEIILHRNHLSREVTNARFQRKFSEIYGIRSRSSENMENLKREYRNELFELGMENPEKFKIQYGEELKKSALKGIYNDILEVLNDEYSPTPIRTEEKHESMAVSSDTITAGMSWNKASEFFNRMRENGRSRDLLLAAYDSSIGAADGYTFFLKDGRYFSSFERAAIDLIMELSGQANNYRAFDTNYMKSELFNVLSMTEENYENFGRVVKGRLDGTILSPEIIEISDSPSEVTFVKDSTANEAVSERSGTLVASPVTITSKMSRKEASETVAQIMGNIKSRDFLMFAFSKTGSSADGYKFFVDGDGEISTFVKTFTELIIEVSGQSSDYKVFDTVYKRGDLSDLSSKETLEIISTIIKERMDGTSGHPTLDEISLKSLAKKETAAEAFNKMKNHSDYRNLLMSAYPTGFEDGLKYFIDEGFSSFEATAIKLIVEGKLVGDSQEEYIAFAKNVWTSELEKKKEGAGELVSSPIGGINLNPDLLDLQIKRDDNGVPLSINLQPIQQMNIDGFVPIIINVTPVTNLPLLLGLSDTDAPTNSTNSGTPTSLDLSFIDKYRNKYTENHS